MQRLALALAVTSALSLGACATVTRGTSDAWSIATDPPGAKVETTNGHFCDSTPCAMKMKRKSDFTATVTKPGYKTVKVSVTHKVAGAGAAGVAGNVILGGVIGLGVDAISGAAMDLTPNPVSINLERDEPVAAAPVVAAAPTAPPAAPVVPSLASAAPVAKVQTTAVEQKPCGMVKQPDGTTKLTPCS